MELFNIKFAQSADVEFSFLFATLCFTDEMPFSNFSFHRFRGMPLLQFCLISYPNLITR